MLADDANAAVPMSDVVEMEWEILGSHGMQAFKYPLMFEMIKSGKLTPQRLVGKKLSLEEGCIELPNMDSFTGLGVKVIVP